MAYIIKDPEVSEQLEKSYIRYTNTYSLNDLVFLLKEKGFIVETPYDLELITDECKNGGISVKVIEGKVLQMNEDSYFFYVTIRNVSYWIGINFYLSESYDMPDFFKYCDNKSGMFSGFNYGSISESEFLEDMKVLNSMRIHVSLEDNGMFS